MTSSIRDTLIINGTTYIVPRLAAEQLNITTQQLSDLRSYDRKLIKRNLAPISPSWVKLNPGGRIYYSQQVITDYKISSQSLIENG